MQPVPAYNELTTLEKVAVLVRTGYGNAENPSRRIISLAGDYVAHYQEFIDLSLPM